MMDESLEAASVVTDAGSMISGMLVAAGKLRVPGRPP